MDGASNPQARKPSCLLDILQSDQDQEMPPEKTHLKVLEVHRLEEISKYFWPTRQVTGFALSNIDSAAGYEPSSARLSTDPVLNALAQLAAHRAECDRAFISIIDGQFQLVVAEATRSISLYNSDRHGSQDGLCVGARPLDLLSGICAGTMPAFTDTSEGPFKQTSNVYADRTRYVINDLALEDDYKHRPYVTGFPSMRYYAEVPIKIATGEVIGTLAVVHNESRTGISDDHFLSLTEIAKTIMVHLENVKAEHDLSRASKLLRGLSVFLRTASIDRSLFHDRGDGHLDLKPTVPGRAEDRATATTSPGLDLVESPLFRPSGSATNIMTTEANTKGVGEEQLQILALSDKIRNLFSNASRILRNAMHVSGVMFLDARLTEFSPHDHLYQATGKSDSSQGPNSPESSSEGQLNVLNPPTEQLLHDRKHVDAEFLSTEHSQVKWSSYLGYSAEQVSPNTNDARISVPFLLPEAVHQSLLHHYPDGHVFNFSYPHVPVVNELIGGKQMKGQFISRDEIDIAIRQAIPNVYSAIFVPLWNSRKDSWFAGGLGWTLKGERLLEVDDLAYLNVYGTSIMAELTRLDLVAMDKAKTNFISSISHELRSPLHGILGNADLLKEELGDRNHWQMVEMIESCGRTLLDTVDHILDYAKMTTVANETERGRLNHIGSQQTPSRKVKSPNKSIFNLDAVLEDTVESIVVGHRHSLNAGRGASNHVLEEARSIITEEVESKTPEIRFDDSVTVVLEIEPNLNWHVESEVAAWRRIVSNLVGNSLKYTDRGTIEVILRTTNEKLGTGSCLHRTVVLTIRDTGRGIGKDFLQNYLFSPFAQEDGLSVGTGLGLSIVQKIVKNLNGTLDVRSEVGTGTQIDVAVPVDFVPSTALAKPITSPRGTICFIEFDPLSDSDVALGVSPVAVKSVLVVKNALVNYAQGWLGLEVVSPDGNGVFTADLIAVSRENLHLLPTDRDGNSTIPHGTSVLVISASKAPLDLGSGANDHRIHMLTQPFGPRRTIEAIEAALGVDRSQEVRLKRVSLSNGVFSHRQDTQIMTSSPQVATEPRKASQLNLLLVDDNEINLKILVAYAAKLSCSFTAATNGKVAVEIYKASRSLSRTHESFDYILMDVSMPVMDGFSATRVIREFESSNNLHPTPIIALTGLSDPDSQQEALASGMDLFLMKPVPIATMKILIEQGLDGLRNNWASKNRRWRSE